MSHDTEECTVLTVIEALVVATVGVIGITLIASALVGAWLILKAIVETFFL